MMGVLGIKAQTNENEAYYAVDQYAEGSVILSETVTFYYDDQRSTRENSNLLTQDGGKLNIPNAPYSPNSANTPFSIKIEFDDSFANYRPTNTSYWFSNMYGLYVEFEGWENFNTSAVTNMSHMFDGLGKSRNGARCDVKGLDLSHFSLSSVTDMSYMLANASASYRAYVFGEENIVYDANVISCLTFSSSINTTGLMKNYETNRLSVPATANNLAYNAFEGLGTSTEPCLLIVPEGFKPQNMTLNYNIFEWKGGNFKFEDNHKVAYLRIENHDDDMDRLYFYYDNNCGDHNPYILYEYCLVPDDGNGGFPIFCNGYEVYENTFTFMSSFADYRPTNTSNWFKKIGYPEDGGRFYIEGLENLNTSEVTNMSYMFYGSAYSEQRRTDIELDLSHFDTRNVTDMRYMFAEFMKYYYKWNSSTEEYDIFSLGTLDFSHFTINPNAQTDYMFQNAQIGTLVIPESANNLASNAFIGLGTPTSPCNLVYADGFKPEGVTYFTNYFAWKGGCFDIINEAYISIEGSKNDRYVFCYDNRRGLKRNTIDLLNDEGKLNVNFARLSNVTTVCIDESFANYKPTNTSRWFYNFHGTIEGLSNLNTSKVTDMSYMFADCTGMTGFDLSSFDIEKVTDMTGMFGGCTNLAELNLSGFDFSNGPITGALLYNCTSLKKLTIPITAYHLSDGCCGGVGTADAPCELVYPDGFNLQNPTSGNGYFRWRSGYFHEAAKPYAVLSGSTLTFYYDFNERNMTGTGTVYHLRTGSSNTTPEWYDNRTSVTKVVFHSSFADARPENCYCWFSGMTNLSEIEGMAYFNTSSVQQMASMFYNCSSLTSIDLSDFDTSNVTWMNRMFEGCTGLNSLDLSTFDTSKVSQMYNMFAGCTGLSSLTLTNFNTSKVSTMKEMFKGCTNLETLDISNFNTAKVTNFTSMFEGCSKLADLDLSSFTISFTDPFYTQNMFKNCSALVSLHIPFSASSLNDGACTGVGTTSNPCRLSYPDGFMPEQDDAGNGYFKWKNGYFTDDRHVYALLSNEGLTLTFYYDNQWDSRPSHGKGLVFSLNQVENSTPAWYTFSGVTSVVFDPSFADARPTTCSYWFCFMEDLSSITGMEYLNTSKVTDMKYMFNGCKKLTEIDLSHFNTSSVTSEYGFEGMFSNCFELTTLDLSNFQFTSNVSTSQIIALCTGLQSLTVNESANSWHEGACQNVGSSDNPCTLIRIGNFTLDDAVNHNGYFVWKEGFFRNPPTPYVVISFDGKTMTFYCDNKINSRKGYKFTHLDYEMPEWMESPIEEVVFDPSFASARPTSCRSWFNGMSTLISITGIEYLNTENVDYYDNMFYGCSSLTSLDLSHFNFSNTEASGLLGNCSALQSLSIPASASNWSDGNCYNVGTSENPCMLIYPADMTLDKTDGEGYFVWKGGYFREREAYAALSDDGKTLTFYYDGNMSSYYVSYPVTNDITPSWYNGTEDVETVVFDSSFADARPTTCSNWFIYKSQLTSIVGIENLNTSKVTDMSYMFHSCSKLTEIDLSHFDTSSVTAATDGFYSMFGNSTNLTTLDLSGFDFNSNVKTGSLLGSCTGLKLLTVNESASHWADDACFLAGNWEDPCTLFYPAGMTLDKTDREGYFIWKGGYFKEGVLGDADDNGTVNIVDVMKTANYVLGNSDPNGFAFYNANVANSDNVVTVTDVMTIVDIVFGLNPSNAPRRNATSHTSHRSTIQTPASGVKTKNSEKVITQ